MAIIWLREAPMSFMMPIWLTCWVMSAVMVLTTRKADKSRMIQLKEEIMSTAVSIIDSMMDCPMMVVATISRPLRSI